MGHGTLVSGTQKLVTGGMTLVGGVQYKLAKGMTLVGGVQRDIPFGSGLCKVRIGSMFEADFNAAYIEIDGTKYSASTTIEVESGTTVKAYLYGMGSSSAIQFNGVGVATTTNGTEFTYEFAVESDLIISMEYTGQLTSYRFKILIYTE